MYGYGESNGTIKDICEEKDPRYLAEELATYAKGENPAISSIAVSLLRIANTLDKLVEFIEVNGKK